MMPNLPFQIKSKFVVLSLHRSGSSLLVDLLDRVPDIKCYCELFKPYTEYTDRNWLKANSGRYSDWKEEVQQNPLKYMNEILAMNTHCKAVGFKLLHGHHSDVIHHVVHSSEFRKIILNRHPVSRYISHARAVSTGKWCKLSDSDSSTPMLTFNVKMFNTILMSHRKFQSIVDRVKSQPDNLITVVDYDDVVNLSGVELIIRDLGITCPPRTDLVSSFRKQTTEPIESLFTNYKELKSWIMRKHTDLMEQPGAPQLT